MNDEMGSLCKEAMMVVLQYRANTGLEEMRKSDENFHQE
jgi:hypothetical protein